MLEPPEPPPSYAPESDDQPTVAREQTIIQELTQALPSDSSFLDKYKAVFDGFKALLAQKKYDQIAKILSQSMLVNVIDVGGQPPFLEMVPALAHGPGLYLICFNLQNQIDEQYRVIYTPDGCEQYELPQYSNSYSVLKVLFHCLSSMACFNPKTSRSLLRHLPVPPPSKAAMIIGTHKDRVPCDTITRVDKIIHKELDNLIKCDRMDEQYYHKYLHMDDEKVLIAVDNTQGNEEVQDHRNRIEQIIKEKFYSESEFPIPASWLMFSILLHKVDRKILSIQECQYIANELGIQEKEHVKDI